MTLNEIAEKAHANAVSKGFYENGQPPVAERLALIHSEVSEALEAWRDNEMTTRIADDSGKPEGFPTEIADVVIRCADLCKSLGIDLDDEVERKMAYNATRPYRHGRVNA